MDPMGAAETHVKAYLDQLGRLRLENQADSVRSQTSTPKGHLQMRVVVAQVVKHSALVAKFKISNPTCCDSFLRETFTLILNFWSLP